MPLTFETRTVGSVAVIRCIGRIVAGNEAASLEAEVRRYFSERTNIVLNLEATDFMDSSGLGLLVRLLGVARQEHLALQLCGVAPPIQRILNLTNLSGVFDAKESEADAVACARRLTKIATAPANRVATVLCVHGSQNILASLRESLIQAGYHVHSTGALPDAMLLLKACRPKVLIANPRALPRLIERAHDLQIPIVEIDDDFAEADAGRAVSALLERVKSEFQRKASA